MGTCFRELGLCGRVVNMAVGTVHLACSVAAVTPKVDSLVLATVPLSLLSSLSQLCRSAHSSCCRRCPQVAQKALRGMSVIPSFASAALKLGSLRRGGAGRAG